MERTHEIHGHKAWQYDSADHADLAGFLTERPSPDTPDGYPKAGPLAKDGSTTVEVDPDTTLTVQPGEWLTHFNGGHYRVTPESPLAHLVDDEGNERPHL